jgi:hypoxanthine-guanine phosphoribosyltransferase
MTSKFIKYFIGQWKMVFLVCIITGALSFAAHSITALTVEVLVTFTAGSANPFFLAVLKIS